MRGADVKLISTDKDTARDLRRLLTAAESGGPSSSAVSTITSPVIAKVVSAISAGDHTQKTARLMTISGGAIVATGQTVQIRNVGSGAVAANTVVLTEPCGKLGQCFVRNASLKTPVNLSVERYIRFVEQLAPATGLENKTWIQYNGIGTSSGVLQTYWDPLSTPTSIDANGNRIWDYKMRGIRFAIDGHNDLWNWTRSLQTQFTSPNVPFTGRAAVLPSTGSHVLLNCTQIEIPLSGFSCFGGGSSIATTHYRVWIDGVDITGIVARGTPFPHDIRINAEVPNRIIGGLMPVSVTAGSYQGKSVWFDLWTSVRVINQVSTNSGDPTHFWSYYPAAQITYYAQHYGARFNSANANANVFTGDQYRVTFSDNGPGGASTLDVATGGGWTLTSTNAGFKLIKAGTGAIELNWAVESPVLTCSIDAKINSPLTGASANMRYLPSGTEYQHRNDNNTVIQYGTWNPQGATVFTQVARAFGSSYFTKGSANVLPSYFTGFPTTITVEKI